MSTFKGTFKENFSGEKYKAEKFTAENFTRAGSQPTHDVLQAPVVWALDAFSHDYKLMAKTAEAIIALAPLAPIHPVYVLNEESFEGRGFTSFLKPALKTMAFKSLRDLLSHEAFDSVRRHSAIQTPRVILESSSSLDQSVSKLMRYAKRMGAQMIALGTHASSPVSRYFTTRFSDVIMREHSVPTLITGPRQSDISAQPKVIIFPTDFSEACRDVLQDVIELARASGAELHFFHKNLHPIDAFVQTGVHMLGGGWVSVESYFQQIPDEFEQEAEQWLSVAEHAGVKACLIRENDPESTADAIVDYARSLDPLSPMLAMALQATPLSAFLLGSVTRDVIRNSPYPVYLPARIAQA